MSDTGCPTTCAKQTPNTGQQEANFRFDCAKGHYRNKQRFLRPNEGRLKEREVGGRERPREGTSLDSLTFNL